MNQLKISPRGFALIERWEGFRAKAYKDIVGIWTIGFGTTRYPNGERVKQGDTITIEAARELLQSQAQKFMDGASKGIRVTLSQNQVDAIGSFIYNLGVAAFLNSTFLRKINAKDFVGAAEELVRKQVGPDGSTVWKGWVFAGGEIVEGLILRRLEEKRTFMEA